MKGTVFLALLAAVLTGCNVDPSTCPCNEGPSAGGGTDLKGPLVNLQVTEYKEAEAFERVIAELEARGIEATILTKPEFVTENCERIAGLHEAGFEIMAFARPETEEGESTTLSALSYHDQLAHITSVKNAIEECLGAAIDGFRCTRFDQNEDTYDILDSLGFSYNLGFVAHTERCMPGHAEDTLPYRAPEHQFWAVPMHSVLFDGEWVAFCDNPFEDRVTAPEWEDLLKSELDYTTEQGRPLLVEVHPYNTGTDEARFAAFVNFLDYAVEQEASFMSVAEIVEWAETQPEDPDCGCLTE
jgi:hypothetical protein